MFGKGKVELLAVRTVSELFLDPFGLSAGSHSNVYVRCTRCGEEFKRPYRYLHQLHNCPTYRTIDGIRQKWCNSCKKFKPTNLFNNNIARHDGLQSCCISCLENKPQSSARLERKKASRKRFDVWVGAFVSQKKNLCQKHGINFNLTTDYLKQLWQQQDGCCYYSRVKLLFGSKALVSAQLDRVIPADGYVIGNVVWSSKAMNNLKNNASLDEVADFITSANFTIPVRCEFKKLSDNAIMPSRKRSTDACLDICSIADITLLPHEITTVRTGIALVVPPGYYYTIEGRSGFWKHGIVPCRGIIDSGYSGEVLIAMANHNNTSFLIAAGDRFAQLAMHRFIFVDIVEVEETDQSYGDRGVAGHGSSGK